MMALIESTSKMAFNGNGKPHGSKAELFKQATMKTTEKTPVCQPPPGLESPFGFEAESRLAYGMAGDAGTKTLSGGTHTSAAILLELVTIVTQISNLDEMLDTVRGSAPIESSEADHWHQVSLQALAMSRKALEEKQMALLQSLANTAAAGQCKEAATLEPSTESTASLDLGLGLGLGASKPAKDMHEKAQSECSTAAFDEGRSDCTFGDVESIPPSPPEQKIEPKIAVEPEAGVAVADPNQSMKLHLEKIKNQAEGHTLIVRKIKQLGFESPEFLAEHFAQYGPIAEVLVAHSITRPSAKRSKGRVRPATVGFVVMGSLAAADAALAGGAEQVVGGAVIEVARHQSTSVVEDEQ